MRKILITNISLQTTGACVCVSKMSSQTTSTPRKAAKRGRKPKWSGASDLCRICASCFAIRLRILGKTPFISGKRENIFRGCYSCLAENLHKHVLKFCIQIVLRCVPKTSMYLASPSGRDMSSFFDKTMEGILTRLHHLLYLFQHSHICISFAVGLELIYHTFLKAGRQNCNNVFRPN